MNERPARDASRLAFYLRMAARDLRRSPGLSLAMFAGLCLSGAIWTTANCHDLRTSAPMPALSPHLHHVELRHLRTPAKPTPGQWDPTGSLMARSRVTYAESALLADSGIPSRETRTTRSMVLVTTGTAHVPQIQRARFASGNFFEMFALKFAHGRGFSRQEDAGTEPVVVLGKLLNEQLHDGQNSVGKTVLVEGRRFRVLGVLAHDQPPMSVWDLAVVGARQDALYLPFDWSRRMLARPEQPMIDGPAGRTFDELLRSPTMAVSFWAELPDAAAVKIFRQHLDRHFTSASGPRHQLRSYAEWQRDFRPPFGDVRFFTLLTGLMLLGAGFNTTRLLLARGFAQREELGIHRALGATRSQLFARQMLSAALLVFPAALLGTALSVPYLELFNALMEVNDIPVRMTVLGFGKGLLPTVAVGLAAAVYPAYRLAGGGWGRAGRLSLAAWRAP